MKALQGAVSAQKIFKGYETGTTVLLGGTERIAFLRRYFFTNPVSFISFVCLRIPCVSLFFCLLHVNIMFKMLQLKHQGIKLKHGRLLDTFLIFSHPPPTARADFDYFPPFFVARCGQRGRILTNFRLFFVAGGGGLKSALFT